MRILSCFCIIPWWLLSLLVCNCIFSHPRHPMAGVAITMSPPDFYALTANEWILLFLELQFEKSQRRNLIGLAWVRVPLQISHLWLGSGIRKYRHSHGRKGGRGPGTEHLLQPMSSEPSLGFSLFICLRDWTESQMVAMGHVMCQLQLMGWGCLW